MLWGGVFGFTWLTIAVLRLTWTKNRVPTIDVETFEGKLVVRLLTSSLPPPLFLWTLTADGHHDDDRHFETQTTGLKQPWLVEPSTRGVYRVKLQWHLTDRAGWTRWSAPVSWSGDLVVLPVAIESPLPLPTPTRHGRWQRRKLGKKSGDPLDVRPYLAGDDLRRLHWPLFAHSGQPFVRTASLAPPPTGHEFFVLDLEASSNDSLDARLSVLFGWLNGLDESSTTWTVAVPSLDLTFSDQAGRNLASFTPHPLPDQPVPPPWPQSLTLVTGSESLGVSGFERQAAQSRRTIVSERIAKQPDPVALHHDWWKRS